MADFVDTIPSGGISPPGTLRVKCFRVKGRQYMLKNTPHQVLVSNVNIALLKIPNTNPVTN